jgi:hypothetical protein
LRKVLLLTADEPSVGDYITASALKQQMGPLGLQGHSMHIRELDSPDLPEFDACIVVAGISPEPNEAQTTILVDGVREVYGAEFPMVILCIHPAEDTLVGRLIQKGVAVVSYKIHGEFTINEAVRHVTLALETPTTS